MSAQEVVESLYQVALQYYDAFLPSIDGEFMTKHPVELWHTGAALNVPILMGVNDDEGTILISPGTNTTGDLQNALTTSNASSYTIDPSQFSKLFDLYPDDPSQGVPQGTGPGLLPSGLQDKRSFLIFGDAIEHSVRRWITSTHSSAGNKVYSYRFSQVPWRGLVTSGATHADEITYVFANTDTTISKPLGPLAAHRNLAQRMAGAWVAFIAELDPNVGGPVKEGNEAVHWPAYGDAEGGSNLVWKADGDMTEVDDYRSEGLDFWRKQRIEGCRGL